MLVDGEGAAIGEEEAQAVMARLGVLQSQLVDCAYVDLLVGESVPAATLKKN